MAREIFMRLVDLGGAIREAERRPGSYGLMQHVTFADAPVRYPMLC